jgi:uncharacterized protein YndB with AHSA1/START domain
MTGRSRPARARDLAAVLVVRRTIAASPERLFDAWTDPQQLVHWWGPPPVQCIAAEIDLRVRGRYRIANRLPDGRVLWIGGAFEVISRPALLVYTWRVESGPHPRERVRVQFLARGASTEVIVTHERIVDDDVRRRHRDGWIGCLDKLAAYAAAV